MNTYKVYFLERKDTDLKQLKEEIDRKLVIDNLNLQVGRCDIMHSIKNRKVNYLIWNIFSECYILKIIKNKQEVHTNHLIKKFWKFPFADDKSYIIGPAYTRPEERRQGLYKLSLKYLIWYAFTNLNIDKVYIFASIKNKVSILGIESTGFKFLGYIKKDLWGRYVFEE